MKLFLIVAFVLISICLFYYFKKRTRIRRKMKSDRFKEKVKDIIEDLGANDDR
jgi:hypothetical protein